MPNTSTNAAARKRYTARIQRQKQFLEHVKGGMLIKDAVKAVGVQYHTYERWRKDYSDFKAGVEAAKVSQVRYYARDAHSQDSVFNFEVERQQYFGHESAPFQLECIDAMEHMGDGDILLILLPPGMGKTTLYEDWVTLKLAHQPEKRHHIGSESITLSRKILGRVRDRLQNTMADPRLDVLITKLGPFAPPTDGSAIRRQPWTGDHFDVWRKGEFDERDYSLAALGFGSQIIGSRSDHLHVDDVQSMKTLGQTEVMVDKFVQDWLSRPGQHGYTSIMGNRIDEGDFYEALTNRLDDDLIHVIRYPAIIERDGEAESLWPQRWPLEKLDRMRRTVGADIWERNWMQRPRSKLFATFDERTVDRCLDPLRRIGHIEPGKAHVIGVDPAVGSRVTPGAGRNAIVTVQMDANGLTPVMVREDLNFTNFQQILAALEDAVVTVQLGGGYVSDVVIEENAMNKALVYDAQLDYLKHRYGFAVRPHTTGINKHDENIGVASMVHTMLKDQIHLPWADDDMTRHHVGELRAQFLAWKPRTRTASGQYTTVRGTMLRQDLLMAFWFVYILWRQRRGAVRTQQGDNWRTGHRLPFKPTSGLVLPNGRVPSALRRTA